MRPIYVPEEVQNDLRAVEQKSDEGKLLQALAVRGYAMPWQEIEVSFGAAALTFVIQSVDLATNEIKLKLKAD